MEGKNSFSKSFFDADNDDNVKVRWEKVFYRQNSNNNL